MQVHSGQVIAQKHVYYQWQIAQIANLAAPTSKIKYLREITDAKSFQKTWLGTVWEECHTGQKSLRGKR